MTRKPLSTLAITGAIISVIASTLTACAPSPKASPDAKTPIGMANPASVHCEQKGGKLEIRQSPEGEIGYCHLPDGTVIEEWELFRRDHPQR